MRVHQGGGGVLALVFILVETNTTKLNETFSSPEPLPRIHVQESDCPSQRASKEGKVVQ